MPSSAMAEPIAESKSPSVALGGSAGAQRRHAWRHVEQGSIVTRMSCAQWVFRMHPMQALESRWPHRGYRRPRRSGRSTGGARACDKTEGLAAASVARQTGEGYQCLLPVIDSGHNSLLRPLRVVPEAVLSPIHQGGFFVRTAQPLEHQRYPIRTARAAVSRGSTRGRGRDCSRGSPLVGNRVSFSGPRPESCNTSP